MQFIQLLLEMLEFRCHYLFGRGKGIPHCVACNGGGLIQNDLIILEREREREREQVATQVKIRSYIICSKPQTIKNTEKYAFLIIRKPKISNSKETRTKTET